jgi:hypothetical protein
MRAIIDTNVILVANGAHPDVSESCRDACIDKLTRIVKDGQVVVDDANEIIEEYLRRTEPHKGSRVGDVFLKWLLNNQGNPKRVERVPLSPTGEASYSEYEALNLPHRCDPSDKKFIAVAVRASQQTPISQATDSKWLDWWRSLHESGLAIEFVCPGDITRFYRRKFPSREAPSLP